MVGRCSGRALPVLCRCSARLADASHAPSLQRIENVDPGKVPRAARMPPYFGGSLAIVRVTAARRHAASGRSRARRRANNQMRLRSVSRPRASNRVRPRSQRRGRQAPGLARSYEAPKVATVMSSNRSRVLAPCKASTDYPRWRSNLDAGRARCSSCITGQRITMSGLRDGIGNTVVHIIVCIQYLIPCNVDREGVSGAEVAVSLRPIRRRACRGGRGGAAGSRPRPGRWS